MTFITERLYMHIPLLFYFSGRHCVAKAGLAPMIFPTWSGCWDKGLCATIASCVFLFLHLPYLYFCSILK